MQSGALLALISTQTLAPTCRCLAAATLPSVAAPGSERFCAVNPGRAWSLFQRGPDRHASPAL